MIGSHVHQNVDSPYSGQQRGLSAVAWLDRSWIANARSQELEFALKFSLEFSLQAANSGCKLTTRPQAEAWTPTLNHGCDQALACGIQYGATTGKPAVTSVACAGSACGVAPGAAPIITVGEVPNIGVDEVPITGGASDG